MSSVYLMSPPRRDWTIVGKSNRYSETARTPNAVAARDEWTSLANAIVDAGAEVLVVPPHPTQNLTGMPYVAEAGEFFVSGEQRRFILPSMASAHRQPEASWIGGFMEGLGFRTVHVPVVWEAQGDVIRNWDGGTVIHTFGTGRLARTSVRAYDHVAHLLSVRHLQIHFHADPWFHGNTFLNIYHAPPMPPRLNESHERVREAVLVCPQALLPGELNRLRVMMPHAEFMFISAKESYGYDTNSLQVGGTILAPSTLSDTAAGLFERLNLHISLLDMSELFGKGGGAPVCLTNRLWGLEAVELPDHVRWSKHPSIEAHTSM